MCAEGSYFSASLFIGTVCPVKRRRIDVVVVTLILVYSKPLIKKTKIDVILFLFKLNL